jgi:type I restriction enzyme S subunit
MGKGPGGVDLNDPWELPEGWKWVKLGDYCTIFNGKTPSKKEKRKNGYPVLKIKDVNENGRFVGHFDSFVDEDFFEKNKVKCLKDGDTLILNAAHNREYVASKNCYISNFGDNVIPTGEWLVTRSNSELLDNRFKHFLLTSNSFKVRIKSLVKGIHLYPKDIMNLNIPLPPLETQRKIVEILEKAEETRRLRAEVDGLAGELLQSVFYEMFGDPVKNPMGWEVVKLGNVLSEDPQNGLYKPSKEYGEGTPILRIDSFYEGKIHNIENLKRLRCTPRELEKFRLRVGDILINRVNSLEYLGKCGLVERLIEDTVYESNMMRIRPSIDICDPTYLTTFLCTKYTKNQILTRAKKAVNQASINQQDVKSLSILLPPLSLQEKFAQIVQQVEAMRQKQLESKQEIENLFGALMQKAFKGELVA